MISYAPTHSPGPGISPGGGRESNGGNREPEQELGRDYSGNCGLTLRYDTGHARSLGTWLVRALETTIPASPVSALAICRDRTIRLRPVWLSRLWVLRPRFHMKAARPCPGYIGLGVFLSGRHISWLAYMYLLSFYVFAPHLLSRIQCCVFDLFAVSTSRKFSLPQPRVEEGLARLRITRPAFFRVENGFLFSIILQCSCVRCSSYTPPLPDRQKRRDMRNEEIQALACYHPTPSTIQLPGDPPFVN